MLDEDQIDYFRTTFGDGAAEPQPVKATAPAPAALPAPPKPLSSND